MFGSLSLFLFFSLFFLSHGTLLETGKGKLRGSLRTSRNGREYHAFTSIPYAKPPLGELRFKSPEPFGSWEGEREASGKDLTMCTQIFFYVSHLRNVTLGQEDCLYLNVFTPKVDGKLPVLVYIHGGGWRCGSPGPPSRADFLMDEDVVLVTFNYRLGALGFLSMEDEAMPGNFGLKDQSLALRWVKENIADFGGDPDSVTIFGESAGGASVHYHMMSPLSRGLFNRAISESGTNRGLWAWHLPGEARSLATRVAAHLGCPAAPSRDALGCLAAKSAKEITDAERIFNFFDFDPAVTFKPVVEFRTSKGAFMVSHPLETETTTPWITGITSSEGSIKIASLLQGGPKEMEKLEKNLEAWLPEVLMFANRTSDDGETTLRIMERYGKERPVPLDSLSKLFSDSLFLWPSVVSLGKHKGPAYFYYFNHRAGGSLTQLSGPKDVGNLGVSHADELVSLFNFKDALPGLKLSEADRKASERLIKLWVNFAKTGNPTPDEKEPQWKKYGKKRRYLKFDTDKSSMLKNLDEEAVKFWNSLPFKFPVGAAPVKDEL